MTDVLFCMYQNYNKMFLKMQEDIYFRQGWRDGEQIYFNALNNQKAD